MHAQLVFLPVSGCRRSAVCMPRFSISSMVGEGIGSPSTSCVRKNPRHAPSARRRAAADLNRCAWADGFVDFGYGARLKQALVCARVVRLCERQHHARSIFVKAMNRRDVGDVEVLQFGTQTQAREQGFA